MIKKLDSMILRAFFGPFIATFSVLVFIFLTQFILKYIDELFGKDLGLGVYLELFFYFSLFMVPQALPLAILLACLITFGSIGEHNELSAIKSAGISLLRMIMPIGVLIFSISIGLLWYNDYVLPKANLKAFSLLYDIRTTKVALDIRPKIFYYGLPGFTVKVNEKNPLDDKALKGVMIYDHSDNLGNNKIILADSGRMFTILNDKYLVLELFKGKNYSEVVNNGAPTAELVTNEFSKSKLVFDLNSFNMNRTDVELFKTSKLMRNINELNRDIDSLRRSREETKNGLKTSIPFYYTYAQRADTTKALQSKTINVDSVLGVPPKKSDWETNVLTASTNQARNIQNFIQGYAERIGGVQHSVQEWEVELYRKYTSAFACFILFLIGAPLGAIIRKGGLGVPVLVSIIFFVIFYLLTLNGEKAAKEGQIEVAAGMVGGHIILLLIGVFFMFQAWNDNSLFDADFYISLFKKLTGKKSDSDEERTINSLDDLKPEDLK